MSHPEWRSRRPSSIPRTLVDVLRERGRVAVLIGGGSLPGGVGSVSRQPTDEKSDWSGVVAEHSIQRKLRPKKVKPESFYGSDGRIECDVEVMEGYKDNNLGIILRFTGIEFTKKPVQMSKHDRPDSPVFYIPVGYNKGMAHLFLTTRGDIFDFQIVPSQMSVSPFFQKELYLPQLATTYDPASMTVKQRNRLVIVGYNPRTC